MVFIVFSTTNIKNNCTISHNLLLGDCHKTLDLACHVLNNDKK